MGQSGITQVAGAAVPPPTVRRITSEAEASELAHRLQTPGRRWPVVVLTIPAGYDEPFGDPEEIKEAVGGLAEVVLMPTSDVSWAFSRAMPPLTQVYGGAGRVYPVDLGWVHDPGQSRLRFAYSPHDRKRITDQLISDALQAALAAGLVEPRTRAGAQQRSGRVQGVIGSRALVTLDDTSMATVWEELTVPNVPLDRLLVRGQRVEGSYDPVSRRLDLRAALRFTDPASALAGVREAYRLGDVVLAEVTAVADDMVTVRLLPGLAVAVGRDAVTSNPKDRMSGLFTVGETVACRLVSIDPVRLRLDDVDDEEEPKPAPSLLPGGPPWLRPPDPQSSAAAPSAPASSPPLPAPPLPVAPNVAPRQPTPLDLARRLAPTQRAAGGQRADTVSAGEKARLVRLGNELAAERATRKALAGELAVLRARAAELEAELARATRAIEQLQTRYRGADLARQRLAKQLKAAQSRADQPAPVAGPLFLDPEEQFRFEVTCEWAQRIPAAEKAAKPLAPYVLAPGFLDSVDQLEGVSRAKVVAVVVEVLTGQVQHIAGRDLHQLRTGGPGSPYLRRASDGATCWRVALQRESAAARRLHYWRTPDGYEFSRVVVHDDYRP